MRHKARKFNYLQKGTSCATNCNGLSEEHAPLSREQSFTNKTIPQDTDSNGSRLTKQHATRTPHHRCNLIGGCGFQLKILLKGHRYAPSIDARKAADTANCNRDVLIFSCVISAYGDSEPARKGMIPRPPCCLLVSKFERPGRRTIIWVEDRLYKK